jgi:hypothetical protein
MAHITTFHALLIGHPLGPMHVVNGAYVRAYSGGMVVVNPSSSKDTVVKLGGMFKALDGASVGPSVSVAHA